MATRGYFGLTDPDWYAFLSEQPRVDEVNFWQPHGDRAFKALSPGQPFFFKLRAPHKAIAGFGFFQRHEVVSARLAWDLFGEMNGAPDFESMIDRISRLRGVQAGADQRGEFSIGCIMLSAPVFFSKSEWITPPADWAKTGIQQGKTYDVETGEGRRVFLECLEKAEIGSRYWNIDPDRDLVPNDAPRYGNPVPVRPRLGQGLFSLAVRDAYGSACAVSGEHSRPVLEAAHIRPYGQGGQHRVENGLLLRSDFHRLYDHGYVTVTPDYDFLVGDRLREEFSNGRSYYGFNGNKINVPANEKLRPDRDLLEWHTKTVYKG